MNPKKISTNSETKLRGLLKKEINEIKKTTQGMKEELNKDMESQRRNIQAEILEIKKSVSEILKIQLKTTPLDWNKWKAEF
jgi:hypothetical protein